MDETTRLRIVIIAAVVGVAILFVLSAMGVWSFSEAMEGQGWG